MPSSPLLGGCHPCVETLIWYQHRGAFRGACRPAGPGPPSSEGVAMTVTADGVTGRKSGARASRPHPARAGAVEQLSRADRAARGKQARAVAPFTFYRGAALPMAADLASTPASGLQVQLCGDAHLSNFGAFASPERNLVFDVNDFDETLPGPFEWDVKRLAASLAVAGRDNGFSAKA